MHGGSGAEAGVVPRAMEAIFASKAGSEEEDKSWKCDIRLSCLEIYQERIYDLLSTSSASTNVSSSDEMLRIRQHSNGDVWIEGCSEAVIESCDDFNKLLSQALKKRSTASHLMNMESSRSHFCVIVSLTQQLSQSGKKKISSKIHMIDLAGTNILDCLDAKSCNLRVYTIFNI